MATNGLHATGVSTSTPETEKGWLKVKKRKVWIFVVALAAVVLSTGGIWLGSASSSRTEKADIDANGNPIVGVKDFSDDAEASSVWDGPHIYSKGPFKIDASDADRKEIEALVKRSLELEFQAMITANAERVPAIIAEYEDIYSNELGDLGKHAGYISTNAALLEQDGYICTSFEMTRFELVGLKVNGDTARAIVEEEDTSVREKVNKDIPTPDRIELKSGRQLEIVLQKDGEKWKITKDHWDFLPGCGP